MERDDPFLSMTDLLDELLASERELASDDQQKSHARRVDSPVYAPVRNSDEWRVESVSHNTVSGSDCHALHGDGAAEGDGKDGGCDAQAALQARQIADLHCEVDACLASLEDWREEKKRDCDALTRELESQYGFTYDEALRKSPNCCGPSACDFQNRSISFSGFDEEDLCGSTRLTSNDPLGSSPWDGVIADDPTPERVTSSARVTCEVEAARRDQAKAPSQDAWFARLREEVEALKQQEAADDASAKANVSSLGLEEPESLNSWCNEVDAALYDLEISRLAGPCIASRMGDGEDTITQRSAIDVSEVHQRRRAGVGLVAETDTDQLERELHIARKEADVVQGVLDDATSRIDAELDDLEIMLRECDSLRSKISAS